MGRSGSCSATLEDRDWKAGPIGGGIEKPAALLLQQPKSPGGENLRTCIFRRKSEDQPDTPGVAVDRLDDASQDALKGFARKGMVEVTDREIVGHLESRYVRDHDLDLPAAVLVSPRRQSAASGLGKDRGDLDADDPAEGPSRGLMDDSTLSTSELHKDVAIGDSEVAKRSG
jgi:hypothetical protein